MNSQFHSLNASSSNDSWKEGNSSSHVFLEKEIKEIYFTQYNDLFSKILTKTKAEFISLLKDQVSLHMKIINKKISNIKNLKYVELFTQKYIHDKEKTTKGLNEIIKNPAFQEKYLDVLNCYIHCHKCSQILHKCQERIIFYKNYIYCLKCQKVYNENQIKLYCKECNVCYYTKLRYIINKKYEYFYPVSFRQYHCPIDEQEKIKCLECRQDLYYNITYEDKEHKKNTIKEVFCLRCKLLYDMNDIYFKCKKCKSDFKSDAILYNNFSPLKEKILLLVHSLRKKKFAYPDMIFNRKCKCEIIGCKKYFHEKDDGILYLGKNLEGQYVIICDKCNSIFKYNDYIWKCQMCKIGFKSKKLYEQSNHLKTLTGFGTKKINKKENIFNSPSICNSINKKIYQDRVSNTGAKANSNIIAKNLFKNKDIDFNISYSSNIITSNKNDNINIYINSIKRNHKNKVIVFPTTVNSESNVDLSNQKQYLLKKLKNNIKKNHYDNNALNEIGTNFKRSKLGNYINSLNKNFNFTSRKLMNSVSFSNNKSEIIVEKEFMENRESNSSTAHITNKNCDEKFNDGNIHTCRCPSCIIEYEIKKKNLIENNKFKNQLLYDDFIENENNNKEKSKKIENNNKNNINK